MQDKAVVINQIQIPDKPAFMKKKTLAYELDVSVDTIENWMKTGILTHGKHYRMTNKVLIFNFQEIKVMLTPDAEV